ncbi:hypothetical protein [Lysobacter olei]
MKMKILPFMIVAVLGTSACDKIAPPIESSSASSSPAPAGPAVAAAPAPFSPRLLTEPVMGVYTPDFPYSLRSKTEGESGNGGKTSLAVEFWGLTVDEAEKRVREALVSSGFQVKAENSGNGAHSARYSTPRAEQEVLVNVSPIGRRKRTAPDSVGTIYFEWSN